MATPRSLPAPLLADPRLAVDDAPARPSFVCDGCGETFEGRPEGKGLFMWTRGDEVRWEEPPLCPECAGSTYADAVFSWSRDFE